MQKTRKAKRFIVLLALMLLVFGCLPSSAASILGFDLDSLWWGICSGLMEIIDWLGQGFNFLVGAETIDVSGNGGNGANIGNLFVTLFNGADDGAVSMTDLYLYLMVGCVLFMLVFVAIGSIKAQFSKSPTDSLQNIGSKSLFALLKMLFIPTVFFVALQAMGAIFEFLIAVMTKGTKSNSIAQALCDACFTKPANPAMQMDLVFHSDYETLSKYVDYGAEFNYLMCFLAACFLLVTLVTVSISLTKRIIEVFFYYLSAPIAICRTPLDDGKSFELWKENVIAKLLSAGGIIICMYLYYGILPQFIDAVDVWVKDDVTGSREVIGKVIKILFIIGGSAVPASASMLMAQLISQGAGQNEANNMMHTQQMLGNALRLGTSIADHASRGVLSGVLGGAGQAGNAMKGAAGALGATPALLGGKSGGGAAAAITNAVSGGGGAAGGAHVPGAMAMAAAMGGTLSNVAKGAASAASGATTTAAAPKLERAASGAAVSSMPGFKGTVGGFLKKAGSNIGAAWSGGSQKIQQTTPFTGTAGKIGAAIGVGIRGTVGTALAIPRALGSTVATKFGESKMGRHLANRRTEKTASRTIAKQEAQRARIQQRNDGKYSGLERAMGGDGDGKTQSTSAYMRDKLAQYEDRAAKIERFLDKKGWSEEGKQAYRQANLKKEADRISAYADVAHGHMDEDALKRFKNFYEGMRSSLYGEKPGSGDEGGQA